MFDIREEFHMLCKNGWLTIDEAEKYLCDENIVSCINSCTSPQKENIFNALKTVPYNKVKVVILGQDPYPNPAHAHGLAFSSKDTVTPESLKNIFKSIDSVYNSNLFKNAYNDLTNWAKQGVLLLNTSLTYSKINLTTSDKKERDKKQQSSQKEHLKVWKPFILNIINKILLINNRPVAMFLWGNSAHELVFRNIKDKNFMQNLHSRNVIKVPNSSVVLFQASHPSPLSVNRGGDFLSAVPVHYKECDKILGNQKIVWTNL